MISDFLEVYLEDDQLWAAGGAAEIQALLAANIDDKGRLNGRVILQHLTTSGVPTPSARVAMDRFVNKRRDRLGTSGPNAAAPRRDSGEVARPAGSGAAVAVGSRGGVGVVSARQAEERTGRRTSPPTVSPSAPTAARVLPWGGEANEEPTQTLHAGDPDATHVAVSPTAKTEAPVPRPAAAVRPAAARAAAPVSRGPAPEISSPGKRSATELRGAPVAEISSPGRSRPPPEVSSSGASRPPELSDPSRPSPERRRAAAEIRGAPVAASVSAQVSSPGRASPPKPAAAAVPAEMRGVLGMNRAEEDAKAKAKADKEAQRARIEAERAASHNLHREARNPDAERGRVDANVFVAAAGALIALLALVFGGHPSPEPAAFSASPSSFTCSEVRAHAGELFCTLAEGTVTGSPESLQAAYASTRAEARQAGFKGVWFFREDTGRVWHAPPPPLAPFVDAAPAAPPSGAERPGVEEAPSAEIEDVLKGLQVAPVETSSPHDDDDDQKRSSKKSRGKRKSRTRRK